MTLTNQERAVRCQTAITAYSDDDTYTNLVDFLADAIHWCKVTGHSFTDALEAAVMHFDAEVQRDDILDCNHRAPSERSHPMTASTAEQEDPDQEHFSLLTYEALKAFWQVVVHRFPQATTGDFSPWETVKLEEVAENAIREWVWANIPSTTNE